MGIQIGVVAGENGASTSAGRSAGRSAGKMTSNNDKELSIILAPPNNEGFDK